MDGKKRHAEGTLDNYGGPPLEIRNNTDDFEPLRPDEVPFGGPAADDAFGRQSPPELENDELVQQERELTRSGEYSIQFD